MREEAEETAVPGGPFLLRPWTAGDAGALLEAHADPLPRQQAPQPVATAAGFAVEGRGPDGR
ncbi:hypothetical protein [Streptomyces abikoensis]|uniref:hypothetical protein n=1 Tax=Streptomyces abikoensis TaxID=97398 RepID=UPI0036BEBC54